MFTIWKEKIKKLKSKPAMTLADTMVGLTILTATLNFYLETNQLMVEQRQKTQTRLKESRLNYEYHLQEHYQK